ncbi:MAG: hypothetical protein KDA25_04765, partial [Phycisphaerales bacterium]|nr:hypothetical protein [Phycisphaerales bacterium]
ERFNVGDFTVTLIELEGEFMPSHAVEFRPNQALTIAAFQSPEVTFMLRLVGDAATVRAARPAFMEMVQDVHPVADRAE